MKLAVQIESENVFFAAPISRAARHAQGLPVPQECSRAGAEAILAFFQLTFLALMRGPLFSKRPLTRFALEDAVPT